jgi:hypothetical protein
MSLSCSHNLITQTNYYTEQSSCVHHVPHYLQYYSSNHFTIHAFNHREHAKLSRVVCEQYRLDLHNPSSNPNLTLKLNLHDLFPLSHAAADPEVNPVSPLHLVHLSQAQLCVGHTSAPQTLASLHHKVITTMSQVRDRLQPTLLCAPCRPSYDL